MTDSTLIALLRFNAAMSTLSASLLRAFGLHESARMEEDKGDRARERIRRDWTESFGTTPHD